MKGLSLADPLLVLTTQLILKDSLIKIWFREPQPKNRIADILSAGEARSRLSERIFVGVIRAARSGGQDVRDPFLKMEELVQSFLKD